jgi:hypothetical protein
MARLKLSQRNPDYQKPDGTLLYSREERLKIWQAKLLAEFFSTRKPSHTQSFQIRAASLLLVDLSEDFSRGCALEPLPKNNANFWARFSLLQRILAGFKPAKKGGHQGRKISEKADSGLGLAAILGDEK